jgi:ATP-binding protein involved in chromosome partitioning
MSGYVCPGCGTEDAIFGKGGAVALAARFGVPLLAQIPIVPAVRASGDRGQPLVVAEPDHPVSRTFGALAERVAADLGRMAPAPVAGMHA